MDMDLAKIMQMMNGGGNKDTSMLMQLLPQLMNSSDRQKNSPPAQINLNSEEVNKTLGKLYNDSIK